MSHCTASVPGSLHPLLTGRWLLRLVLAFVCALALGCGEESGPDVDALGARDILGLEVEHVAAMSVDERATLVTTLETTWPTDARTVGVEHLVELTSPASEASNAARIKAHIGALDAQRAAAELPPLPLIALDVDRQLAVELLASPTAMLERTDAGLWQVRAQPDDAARPFDGYIVWDAQWPEIERQALGGLDEREAIERLEPALRQLLAHTGDGGSVRVVPAPRAPLLIWYAPVSRTVLVNPTLLYLLDPGEPTRATPRRQTSAERATADASPDAEPGSGYEPDIPDGVDPPPAFDNMQDGGGGSSDCDCGNDLEEACGEALTEFFLVAGIVLLGAAVFAGLLLLIVFLV